MRRAVQTQKRLRQKQHISRQRRQVEQRDWSDGFRLNGMSFKEWALDLWDFSEATHGPTVAHTTLGKKRPRRTSASANFKLWALQAK